jgi:TP901-1 family phage major tail protein
MAERGIDFLVYVNVGTALAPSWQLVGGQRDATLNRSMEPIDITAKDNYGWAATLDGVREWSIDFDWLYSDSDTGVTHLEDAFTAGDEVLVKIETPGADIYSGGAYLTELTLEMPYEDVAAYSGTLTGNGALTKT